MSKHKRAVDTRTLFEAAGFDTLTPIQAKAVPRILQKRDCLVVAPTGSGKTECAVIPAFHHIQRDRAKGRIRCLYITPLRALNRDVFRRITKYAQDSDLDIQIRHGDTPQSVRRRIVESPPDVLITTPESAVVLLSQPKMLDALSELQWVIIDEVHEMLANERGSQLSITLERLQLNTRYPLIRIGLSATLGNTTQAAKFVVGTHRKCLVMRDSSLRKYDVQVLQVTGDMPEVADAIVSYVSEYSIKSPILLFTNTRGEAELLASMLKSKTSIPVEMHHGSLSKQVREDTESYMREGKEGIVVCTSSLEMGIDVGSVDLVIHYGSPRQVSKMVQRIGRSRHQANRSAKGLVVTNRPDDKFEAEAILGRIKRGSLESQTIQEAPLDVLAHHLVGLLLQKNTPLAIQEVCNAVAAAYPYRSIREEDVRDVLDVLDARSIVKMDSQSGSYAIGSRARMYHLENLSTIPDMLKFRVFDTTTKRLIGSLDQRFVGDNGDAGSIFVLRGSQWKIINVDEKALRVNVEPARSREISVPYWDGGSIPVDMDTANIVGAINERWDGMPGRSPIASSITVESARRQGIVVLHSCLGTKINTTLAALFSSVMSGARGGTVRVRSDAYRIALTTAGRITNSMIQETLHDEYDLREVITALLVGTHNINWRVWQVAKRFGIIPKGTIYERKRARFLYERYAGTPIVHEALRELFHDKYDVQGTDMVLQNIRNGTMKVQWLEVEQISTLGQPILEHTVKKYQASDIDPDLLNIVKERLQKTRHRLVCARCGRWQRVVETREVKTMQPCPYCKGRQVTATFYSDYELPKIISKKHNGQKLNAQEDHAYKRAWKVSSLIETFGTVALTVLSGYGVGADTGARILRNMVNEEYMFRQIYEAEKQYVLTRGFWDR